MVLRVLALRPERRPKPDDRRKRPWRGRGVEQRQTAFSAGPALWDDHRHSQARSL